MASKAAKSQPRTPDATMSGGVDTGALGCLGQRRLCRVVGRQHRGDARVAFGDEALVVLPRLQRLAQREDMLEGPGAAQRFEHGLRLVAPDLHVAQRQQCLRRTLPGHHRAYHSQTAGAGQ